jgi:hypothetical protein
MLMQWEISRVEVDASKDGFYPSITDDRVRVGMDHWGELPALALAEDPSVIEWPPFSRPPLVPLSGVDIPGS